MTVFGEIFLPRWRQTTSSKTSRMSSAWSSAATTAPTVSGPISCPPSTSSTSSSTTARAAATLSSSPSIVSWFPRSRSVQESRARSASSTPSPTPASSAATSFGTERVSCTRLSVGEPVVGSGRAAGLRPQQARSVEDLARRRRLHVHVGAEVEVVHPHGHRHRLALDPHVHVHRHPAQEPVAVDEDLEGHALRAELVEHLLHSLAGALTLGRRQLEPVDPGVESFAEVEPAGVARRLDAPYRGRAGLPDAGARGAEVLQGLGGVLLLGQVEPAQAGVLERLAHVHSQPLFAAGHPAREGVGK